MSLDESLARTMSVDLVRVFKLMQALRASAPRFHESIEQASYPVLLSLHHEPARVSALADRIHSDASVVSRQVSHLEALGIVRKDPDPADRRASVVSLTAEGIALVDTILEGRGRWFARMLSDWTTEQAREFDAGLVRLAGSLQCELDSAQTTAAPDQETA